MYRAIAATVTLIAVLMGGVAGAAEYRLGPGDVVKVAVYAQPDLDTRARVSESGSIGFPLLGRVDLDGLTETEAEQRIETLLAERDIVRSPQVSLIVEAYRSRTVSILGAVTHPGTYPVTSAGTVIDLVAQAGGLSDTAGDTAVVTRAGADGETRETVDLQRLLAGDAGIVNPALEDGDRLFVPRMAEFYVYGQVNHPGVYRLEGGMTVMQALSVAGGLTPRATERGLTIRRASKAGEVVSLSADLDDPVLPRDVVHVKESLF